MPGVNPDTMLTHDELSLAWDIAQARYLSMLDDEDFSEADLSSDEVKAREGWLAHAAWRQALAFVLTRRQLAEGSTFG